MMSKNGSAALIAGVLVTTVAWASPAGAAQPPPVQPPPSTQELVTTTNAMMQPSDVPAALQSKEAWSVSYSIPPGGQDPTPVCIYGPVGSVSLSQRGATGYHAGTFDLDQQVYRYSSAERARAAWSDVDAKTRARCRGSWTDEGRTTTLTTGRLDSPVGGPAGWWIRSDVSGGTGSYVTVMPVGDSIQTLRLLSATKAVPAPSRRAMNQLAVTLAARYAEASALPLTQDALLTTAERTMLTPADVPAELPYTLPANGGWSSFSSMTAGESPWVCSDDTVPAGVSTFDVDLGGWGDVTAVPGSVSQQIQVYASPAAAQAAWQALRSAALACTGGSDRPLSQTKAQTRQEAGTSALSFDGTPGIWTREIDTYPDTGTCTTSSGRKVACDSFSTRSYVIHLLVGTAIQSVTYYLSVDGIRIPPLDQLPVNVLAESLAQRWMAAESVGG
jgi:hypothetical protein